MFSVFTEILTNGKEKRSHYPNRLLFLLRHFIHAEFIGEVIFLEWLNKKDVRVMGHPADGEKKLIMTLGCFFPPLWWSVVMNSGKKT